MEDGRPARRARAYARRAGTSVLQIPGRYNDSMPPRIAIPVPHSADPEYAERALPQYVHAVEMAGGEAVRIPLDQSPAEGIKLIGHCDAVLLPGSQADVDPTTYKARTDPNTPPADPG